MNAEWAGFNKTFDFHKNETHYLSFSLTKGYVTGQLKFKKYFVRVCQQKQIYANKQIYELNQLENPYYLKSNNQNYIWITLNLSKS